LVATLVGGAAASGGAASLNHYFDRDLDERMRRTRHRPLPAHRVSTRLAVAWGIALNVVAFVVLVLFTNLLAASLAIAGTLFYILVYTLWLKRTTAQNIVIGGAAGAGCTCTPSCTSRCSSSRSWWTAHCGSSRSRDDPRRRLVRHRRAADAARVAGMAYGPLPGRPRRDARRARVADRRARGRALQRPHGPAHAPHGRRRPAPSPGTAGASAPSRASLRSAPRRRPSDRALTSRARGPPPAPAPARG